MRPDRKFSYAIFLNQPCAEMVRPKPDTNGEDEFMGPRMFDDVPKTLGCLALLLSPSLSASASC